MLAFDGTERHDSSMEGYYSQALPALTLYFRAEQNLYYDCFAVKKAFLDPPPSFHFFSICITLPLTQAQNKKHFINRYDGQASRVGYNNNDTKDSPCSSSLATLTTNNTNRDGLHHQILLSASQNFT